MSNMIPTEETFLKDVSNHSMTVLLDNGVYRHISFSNNGSFNQQFDIVTWPEFLAYPGDMGCFVFSRVNDMFLFFRNDEDKKELKINPSYWGEKLQSVDRDGYHPGYKEYSPEKFKERVEEKVKEWIEEFEGEYDSDEEELETQRKEFARQLRNAVTDCVTGYADDGEYKAHESLQDFSFVYESNRFTNSHKYEFSDTWEWDLKDYTYRYIWCLYALVWGIQKYDALEGDS
jgi:hypothetical protein